MVDEVEIKNVGGRDGVASEVTLQRLVTALEKSKSLDNKSKKNIEDLAKASKKTTKSFESFSEEIENTTTIVEDVGKALKKTFTLDNFGKVLGYAAGVTTNFAKEVMDGSTELGDFAQHIPIVGGSLGRLTEYFQTSLDTFRDLSDIGAGFGNNMLAMRQAAAQAGLGLDQFAQFVSENSTSMNLLGATTSQGADRFGKLSRVLRSQENGLLSLGFTIEGVNDGFASFVQLQAMTGRLRGQSDQQLIKGAQNYLLEIDRLARVTGQSRKQIQEEMNGRMQAANFNVLAAQLSGEALENFTLNTQHTSAMLGQGFADVMTDLGDGVAQSDFAKRLAATVPGLSDLAEANARGELSQEEYQKRMQQLMPQITQFADNLGAAGVSSLMGKAGFSEFMESLGNARLYTQRVADASEAQAEQLKRSDVTRGFAEFSQNLLNARTALEDAFIRSGLADTIGAALLKFGDLLINVINYLGDFAKAIEKDGFLSAIGGVLMDGLKGIFNNPGTIAAVVGGIAALFAAKAVTGALVGAFKTAVTSTVGGAANRLLGRTDTPSAGGGRKGGGFARGATNAGKGIGGFLGQLSEALMKGAAAGLKAFTPPVLQGAVILGGVITAIGAGIAGASWILGKALPTFVDGLKKFEDIDGGALVDAAKGMGAISVAMAAFGTGTAVAGLGAMVGGITGAIGKLFGADDPLEKLKEFGEANINAAQVKNNAEAMVAFSKAMAAAGGGNAAEGLGALVSGIAGGLGKLAGGSDTDDVIDSMIAFSEKQVNSDIVKSNAEAMVAFSKAMSVAAGANAAEGLGTFVSGVLGGIGAFFGGESSLEQFKRFGETDLDPNGLVGKNAEAMGRFSTAMANVVSMPEQGVFESFKSAMAGLFGGDTAFSQLEDFANLDIDRDSVKANAEAMMYFSTAMANVSMMPEQGVFESISSALASIFGGENAADQLKAFGAEDFDSKGFVKSNAEAMMYFSTAMANVSMMPEQGVFKSIGSALAGIFGGDSALDQLKTFGETNLDPNGIVKSNAEAMVSMSTAFSSIKSVSDVKIDKNLVNRLNQLSSVGDLSGFAANIKQLSGLDATLGVNALNSLDSSGVVQYTTAMESLVEVLKELNQELTKDNKAGFGTGTNAGTVVSKMDSIGGGGGSGMSQDTAEKLNTTLASVLQVLEESRDYHKDTAKAVKSGDLQRGV